MTFLTALVRFFGAKGENSADYDFMVMFAVNVTVVSRPRSLGFEARQTRVHWMYFSGPDPLGRGEIAKVAGGSGGDVSRAHFHNFDRCGAFRVSLVRMRCGNI